MLTLQALICFEGFDDWNGRTIWSCATSSWHPLKRARLRSKADCIIQVSCGWVWTYANCETTSNIVELQPPRSIKNASPFRGTMADYVSSSFYFVEGLLVRALFANHGLQVTTKILTMDNTKKVQNCQNIYGC